MPIFCFQDHDRRIREATQQAFEQLVLKVRRSLAPFLKSLMGHWILSQCDTYTPAASAACQAFQAAFSPAKQPEALSFCKDEILTVSARGLAAPWRRSLSSWAASIAGAARHPVKGDGRFPERYTVRRRHTAAPLLST